MFVAEQTARLHEPHISPVTDLVNSLRTPARWLPYVAPLHGGIRSRMLTVLRDPGRGTLDRSGSGMLSVENDDQTAETMFNLMEMAGLTPSEFTLWNAYPWFIDRAPTSAEMREAVPTLATLVAMMPELEVVILHGRQAQDAWRFGLAGHRDIRRRRLIVLETYHPSVQALRTPSPQERARRVAHRIDTWREAGEILSS